MSLNSINTNTGAMIALQTLNLTSQSLTKTQNEVSTGLKVGTAKDDGSIWAIAQDQRAQVTALDAVTDSLNRASSTIDVGVAAGQEVSDLLNQMKEKALEASDASQTTDSRAALNTDFQSMLKQIKQVVGNANFNGANLVASGATALLALVSASGGKLTIASEDLSIGGPNIAGVTTTSSIGTAALASALVVTLSTAITKVNSAVAKLGTASNAVSSTLAFNQNLQNTLTTGVGNLVDADVAAESATLTALQTKQQLGVQALSIANSSSSVLLSLFRGG